MIYMSGPTDSLLLIYPVKRLYGKEKRLHWKEKGLYWKEKIFYGREWILIKRVREGTVLEREETELAR